MPEGITTIFNRVAEKSKMRGSSRRPSTIRRGSAAESNEELWKGLVAGLAAGAAASLVMNLFQAGMKKVESHLAAGRQHAARYLDADFESNKEQSEAASEPTTNKVAEEISEKIFDHELSEREKKRLGSVVHYAFGASVGALYGGLAEYQPSVTTGGGLIYGAAVWAAADETMLPVLGLSKGPTEYPAEVHLKAFSSHLVYGLSLEMGRRFARRVLDAG